MRAILNQLNKTQGVRGSMIVNRDGIIVASDFSTEVDESAIGAVSSSILGALDAALKRVGLGKFQRFVIGGTENKVALIDAGPSLLLVLLNNDVNLGLVGVELKDAADAIAKKAQL